MKTIMVVGAGKAQVPLIKAAKKERYHTVVCDINPDATGVSLADEYYRVSTKDRYSLLKVAKIKQIDGIVANSEYAMCDVAFISNNLGLVGNSEKSISILSSKSNFRKLQKETGLFAPKYLSGEFVERIKEGLLKFPIIIKPDQNSGTRGTIIVEAPDDYKKIERGLFECAMISRNGKAIVEEYVPGTEPITIEGEIFIHNNEILWDGLFLTIRSRMATMIPMTYVFPFREKETRVNALKETLIKAFRAANVLHGEYNIEMYSDDEKLFIFEINPRQGGNELPRYVQEHCGIDYYRLLVTTSIGDDYYWNKLKKYKREKNYIVHHMLYPRKAGCFKGLQIDTSLLKYIYNSHIEINVGEKVENTIDGSSSIGYVDLMFSDVEEQIKVSSNIEKLITLEIE